MLIGYIQIDLNHIKIWLDQISESLRYTKITSETFLKEPTSFIQIFIVGMPRLTSYPVIGSFQSITSLMSGLGSTGSGRATWMHGPLRSNARSWSKAKVAWEPPGTNSRAANLLADPEPANQQLLLFSCFVPHFARLFPPLEGGLLPPQRFGVSAVQPVVPLGFPL